MTIITRLVRLFKADFHRVLDHIEEPEALLRQAVREMQDCLYSTEINLCNSRQRDKELIERLAELELSLKGINSDLDLCFESDKEDLARALVKRKLETNALKKRLTQQQAVLHQSITQQQEALTQNQLSLEHLRQKIDCSTTRDNNNHLSDFDSALASVGCTRIADTDLDVAFLTEKNLRNAS